MQQIECCMFTEFTNFDLCCRKNVTKDNTKFVHLQIRVKWNNTFSEPNFTIFDKTEENSLVCVKI